MRPRGPESPILLAVFKKMAEKKMIQELVSEFLKGTGLFLVSVKVSSTNRITVLADKKEGITIDECAAIHRHIENSIDRDKDNFELQVSSPGLDLPFTVIEQYFKNEDRRVEVIDNEGSKQIGKLKNVTEGGFELDKGSEVLSFNFDQIKSTRVILTI